MTINETQFDALLGFKLHIWNCYHESGEADFSFWAQKLDELKIQWYIQNTVAILMETRANGFSSLKNLLASKEIFVANL